MYYCYNVFFSNNLNVNVICNIIFLIFFCCRKCFLYYFFFDIFFLNFFMFLRVLYFCNKFIVVYEYNVNLLKMDLNF